MNIFNFKKKFDYDLISAKLTNKDGIIALIFWAVYVLILWTNTRIFTTLKIRDYNLAINDSAFYDWLYILPYNILLFVGLIVIVKSRKQKLRSIGFNLKTSFNSLLMGIVIATPILAYKIFAEGLFSDISRENLLWVVLYFATYMLVKEIMYRGFIQPRVIALVKNKWLGIAIVAVLFSVLSASGIRFELEDLIFHFVLAYFYTRHDNFIGSFLIYFAWNIY